MKNNPLYRLYQEEFERQAKILVEGFARLTHRTLTPEDLPGLVRAAHSLKGAALLVNEHEVGKVARSLESFLKETNDLLASKCSVDKFSGYLESLGVNLAPQHAVTSNAEITDTSTKAENPRLAYEECTQEQPRAVTACIRARILIVEDSVMVRDFLNRTLEAAGFECETAIDGQEAIEKIENGDFDLVTTDYNMPRLNGAELIDRLRAHRRSEVRAMPIVLISQPEGEMPYEDGGLSGASAFYRKNDLKSSSFLDAVKKLLSARISKIEPA